MFPRYGSYPGFNPIVELSMTFHTQVVGANGQRQAMFIERMPGLAEVILDNFTFGPARRDGRLLGRRHDRRAGRDGPWRAAARPPGRSRSPRSSSRCPRTSTRPSASRLLDEADLVLDLCTPHTRRAGRPSTASNRPSGPARPSPPSPSSMPQGPDGRAPRRAWSDAAGHHPASVVGVERSRALFDDAYRRACTADRPCHHPGRPVRLDEHARGGVQAPDVAIVHPRGGGVNRSTAHRSRTPFTKEENA